MLKDFKKEAEKRSKVTERVFLNLLLGCGFKGREATKDEQTIDHIDVVAWDVLGKIWPKGSRITIDVKDQKWTGYDEWKFDEVIQKPYKTGVRKVPWKFPIDEPCCSFEYQKYQWKGNTICDNQPDYYAFESVEEGTEPHANKQGEIFEIGKSFYLIECCVVKESALKTYDEYNMRKPEAVIKRDMERYYQLLIQKNDRGDNYYCHVPMKHIQDLPHIYLKIS